ncbi:dTDP-4-dehydrorhamnose reductase [Flavobacteriaceae bacterium AU392]|nr:dTDP-4-dehydrorhamnose reductase [Flavobacteriaceae bacterium]RKM84855.1 dTDP-4-dehydrorhamnose reductase [Flavobacteriaceae bacterium AU392]
MRFNILVIGAKGQLGETIRRMATEEQEFIFHFVTKAELDITNEDIIHEFFKENKFRYCINCAAYTNVKEAEKYPKLAYEINAEATKTIANACKTNNTILIHISTDYVFNGESKKPYLETDITDPINEYGKSKLKGELYIQEILENHIIIRTSWLYSEYGNNFVKTMLKLADEKEELNVVDYQIGSPTYTGDLAKAIIKIISLDKQEFGVYNYCNSGQTSWYNFAKTIFRIKNLKLKINPVEFESSLEILKRPVFSVLDYTKIKKTFSVEIPYWKDSLKIMISNLDR